MPGLAVEVGDYPMLFPELDGIDRKRENFATPQSTTDQKSQDCIVPLASETIALGLQQKRTALIGSQPVSQSHADPSHAFDPADAGRKLWTEQPGIGGLVCYAPDRRQPQVDRCWSEVSLLQMDSVSQDNGAIEGDPRF